MQEESAAEDPMATEARIHNPSNLDLASPDGFRGFYAEALPRVYGYFYSRIGGNRAVAEDLTQETFFAAVREISVETPICLPLPWILGIARHKLLDHLRRSRTARLVVIASGERLASDTEEQTAYLDFEQRDQVLMALAAISSPYRDVLILHYMDGLPVAEIAALLGRSPSAAQSLLARARNEFRAQYLELDDGD
jgi:RNA polymerase sigma-70 factor (ECF subfamily)